MSTESSVRLQKPGPLRLGIDCFPQAVEKASLYIHIPFCESRCRYCNFYFETGWSARVLQRTLDTILEEARLYRSLLSPDAPSPLQSIYLGGGTPSIIPPPLLREFLQSLRSILQPDPQVLKEFALEANPESLKYDHLKVFASSGITRLSLGVQSFHNPSLAILGRKARQADIYRALGLLADARNTGLWHGFVNVDLMVGLPEQNTETLKNDLDELGRFKPDHVSVYTLTPEERTSLEVLLDQGSIKIIEEEAEDLWFQARDFLESQGLHNYESSNFAKPGAESLHNSAYWHLDPYIGLGPGAVGTLQCRYKDAATGLWKEGPVRFTNPDSFAYSRPSRPYWEQNTEILGSRDWFLEHFITGLRTQKGLDCLVASRRCSLDYERVITSLNPLLDTWQRASYLEKRPEVCLKNAQTQTVLSLTDSGRNVLNLILEDLMDLIDTLY